MDILRIILKMVAVYPSQNKSMKNIPGVESMRNHSGAIVYHIVKLKRMILCRILNNSGVVSISIELCFLSYH